MEIMLWLSGHLGRVATMKIKLDPIKLSGVVAFLIKWWAKSIRYAVGPVLQNVLDRREKGESFILAVWHEELFQSIAYGCVYMDELVGVVSPSKDGEFISATIAKFGHSSVRGSSSRGGVKALLQIKRDMDKRNRIAVFAIDGPRGPRREPKDGVIFLAQRAGAKIVPMRSYCSSKKIFKKTWDQFQLPRPFCKCDLVFGEPYEVTKEKLTPEVMEQEREKLKKIMNGLVEE